jgi:hypothetical protein
MGREMEAAVQIAVVGCSQRSPVAGALIDPAGSLGGTRTSLRELRFGAADGLPAGSMETGIGPRSLAAPAAERPGVPSFGIGEDRVARPPLTSPNHFC